MSDDLNPMLSHLYARLSNRLDDYLNFGLTGSRDELEKSAVHTYGLLRRLLDAAALTAPHLSAHDHSGTPLPLDPPSAAVADLAEALAQADRHGTAASRAFLLMMVIEAFCDVALPDDQPPASS